MLPSAPFSRHNPECECVVVPRPDTKIGGESEDITPPASKSPFVRNATERASGVVDVAVNSCTHLWLPEASRSNTKEWVAPEVPDGKVVRVWPTTPNSPELVRTDMSTGARSDEASPQLLVESNDPSCRFTLFRNIFCPVPFVKEPSNSNSLEPRRTTLVLSVLAPFIT
jgi:hypothetical protein